jgi:FSR family fosmidomycin resistance protein-like MFS transporter
MYSLIASHIVDDFYQGAIPTLIPFFVLERHYSFTQVAGLTLASTILSSVAQPIFGILTDKKRMMWLMACGMMLAGVGIGLVGFFNDYLYTWVVIALSGLGVAAYHPEAARTAREVTGGSQIGMSWFSLGGNIGFALAPIVVTPLILLTGIGGSFLLAIPALAMGAFLLANQGKLVVHSQAGLARKAVGPQRDDWRSFVKLTGLIMFRSVLVAGLSSFLALYVTKVVGGGKEMSEVALIIFLGFGTLGTLTGGWLADRFGRVRTIRAAYLFAIPSLVGLTFAGSPWIFPLIALTALTTYVPFSLQVTLGQDYLPSRVGTASGVSLGLAVSVGGMFVPLLGWLADATSLQLTLTVLIILPALALFMAFRLNEPGQKAKVEAEKPANELPEIESATGVAG